MRSLCVNAVITDFTLPTFMKLPNLIAICGLVSVTVASAATGIFESYGILKINSSTNTYYDMQAVTANPDFQGANLGTFNATVGNTLTLAGAEIKTWKDNGGDVTGGKFDYRVYQTGDTPGAFSEITLNWVANLAGSDQKWDNTTANINLLTGLANGNYTLEVYAYATSNQGNPVSNNGGANYKATFTVIPEPTAALLGGLGLLGLLRRRR